jgi:DNA polymerase III delta' subunit
MSAPRDRPARFLRQALGADRLPHALLFAGPDPRRCEATAKALAACLMCEQTPSPPDGCGSCSACRRVASGHHPDLHLVLTESEAVERGLGEPDGGRRPSLQLRVEQIRELAREMRMRPFEGRAKVAIVVDAHKMNDNAANALLKTLEEPPADATLVLIAPHERALLPTLVSRCARLRFPPAPPAAEDVAPADDDELIALLERLTAGTATDRMDTIEAVGRDRRVVDEQMQRLEVLLVSRLSRAVIDGQGYARPLLSLLDAFDDWREGMEVNAHVQMALEELFLLRAE